MKTETKSVGLFVAHQSSSGHELYLGVRGTHDSYPGAVLPTAHGKLEDEEIGLPESEGYRVALAREMRQELGDRLAELLLSQETDFIELSEQVGQRGPYRFFLIEVPFTLPELEELADLNEELSGFLACKDSSKVREIRKEEKENGIPPNEIATWPMVAKGIEEAFLVLRKTP
jgi:hypothetical protein